MTHTRRRTTLWTRQGPRRFVLAVPFLVAILVPPLGATTADDLCAPEADPCVVSDDVDVTNGSMLLFGDRHLTIAKGGALSVGPGEMTIAAGSITVESGADIQAIGLGEPGGSISLSAGTITIVGTINADGSDGGTISMSGGGIAIVGTISANGSVGGTIMVAATAELLNGGTISAEGTSATGVGGSVELMGATVTVAGVVTCRGQGDSLGGCVTISADGNVDLVGPIRVHGGDGGEIAVVAGLVGGNLRLQPTAVLNANGEGANGGSGGVIELSARGNGIDEGHVFLDGTVLARAGILEGGDGGCITVSAAGDVTGTNPDADLNVNSGSPDGFAGEISLVAAANIALKTELSAQGSGSEGVGGDIEVQAGGDLLLDDNSRVSVVGPGDGGSIELIANQGEVTIESSSIDASGLGGGDGGDLRIRASGMQGRVVIGGAVLANGAARGGAIDVTAGDAFVLAGPATAVGARVQAQGGSGGAVTLRTLRGRLQIDGRVLAPGLVSNGGSITAVSGSELALRGKVDTNGNSRGGNVGLEASGAITIDGTATASGAADGSGGRVDIVGAGSITVNGELTADGSASTGTIGGIITLHGCDVTLVNGSSLSAKGAGGSNRVTGRRLILIGGDLMADPASGRNELMYREAANPPVVFASATVVPIEMRIVNATLEACAVCGDSNVEPPETCDDGNQENGDGCSSTCQIEAGQCDVDGDGDVDTNDITWLEAELFDGDGDRTLDVGGGSVAATVGADANEDGRITAADLSRCIELFAGE